MKKPAQLYYDYSGKSFGEENFSKDPLKQFRRWFHEALKSKALMPNAMTLATTGLDGKPQARIVLLKDFSARGFVFYTHYTSPKGQEIRKNPDCTLVFYWPSMERQVRISGRARKVAASASDAYFHSRPRAYQIQAHLANQSQKIENRSFLVQKNNELTLHFKGKKVPRPKDWGGYNLTPESFEFWQGQPSRLHDRLRYVKTGSKWIRQRLAPQTHILSLLRHQLLYQYPRRRT